MSVAQPKFKSVSRNTIKSDIFKIYEDEKLRLKQLFEKNDSKIAITADMWTSTHQKKGFMAITAHFIDESWTLRSHIIGFLHVPCPHTAEVLSNVLSDIIWTSALKSCWLQGHCIKGYINLIQVFLISLILLYLVVLQ